MKQDVNVTPRLLRQSEASRYLGISPTSLWRLVRSGKIHKPIKQGTHYALYEKRWLDDYADRLVAGEVSAE